jgi:hypothetical protein
MASRWGVRPTSSPDSQHQPHRHSRRCLPAVADSTLACGASRGNLHILAFSTRSARFSNVALKREHTTRAGREAAAARFGIPPARRAPPGRVPPLPPAPPPRARRSGVAARAALVRGGARAGGWAQRAAGCRRRTNCLRPIRRFVKNFRVRMVGAAMVLRKPLRAVRTASSDDADDADGDRERIEIAPSSLNLLLRL